MLHLHHCPVQSIHLQSDKAELSEPPPRDAAESSADTGDGVTVMQ